MRIGALVLLTAIAAAPGCATYVVPSEICLHHPADRCLGPSYTSLSKRQLRDMNGSFTLSCDGTDKLSDEYRESCIARLREAHAALSKKWSGSFAFSPLRDSDVQPTYPCVDFADKQSGVLTGGWCWEQLQVQVRYSVVE